MHMSTHIRNVIFILTGGALIGVLFLYTDFDFLKTTSPKSPIPQTTQPQTEYVLKGATVPILISIARTPKERELGLSNSPSLQIGAGKLFIFDTPERMGFWMKEMKYSIDIIWIDSSWRVIDIEENVSPETYPRIFYPQSRAQYVLEMNAFEAQKYNITPGVVLSLQENTPAR